MECSSVCIGTNDHDGPEFYSESFPHARHAVTCGECGRLVGKGTQYFKVCGKWDGVFSTFRQCMPCHEIQRVFSCGEGWEYGGLWEAWDNADGFRLLSVFDPCLWRLSMEARTFLVDRWWKWLETQR